MLAAGLVLGWVAYGVGSYGWVLLRGWDIPARAWFSPLNPYQWPKGGTPPVIPDTAVFPSQVHRVTPDTGLGARTGQAAQQAV